MWSALVVADRTLYSLEFSRANEGRAEGSELECGALISRRALTARLASLPVQGGGGGGVGRTAARPVATSLHHREGKPPASRRQPGRSARPPPARPADVGEPSW